jgi:glycosyltransferase involved in cell wall biosynthesis
VKPRIALLGAFPFPTPQGSQRYFADQARALTDAGARVTAITYGAGAGHTPDGIELRRTPAWTSPERLVSGFAARKPLADLALTRVLLDAHREHRFDTVLAHNAEATLAALAARARGGPAVVYVAHTLWRQELASHLPTRFAGRAGPILGSALDRLCARRADAVLALTDAAREALVPHARGPVLRIPPGWRPEPAPEAAVVREACSREGLEPDGYVVYTGNLDRYQGLDLLDRAAAAVPELPCVAVTHAPAPGRFAALRIVRARDVPDARALVFGASCVAVPRRISGGFPLKLIDAMDARRAIVGHPKLLGSLQHGESAWCLPPGAGPSQWAAALAALHADAPLRGRLGAGARAVLESEHAWPKLADRTLQLASSLR